MVNLARLFVILTLLMPWQVFSSIQIFDISPRICFVEKGQPCKTTISANWSAESTLCLTLSTEKDTPIVCGENVKHFAFPITFKQPIIFQLIEMKTNTVFAEQSVGIMFNANQEINRRRLSWSLF